MIHYSVLLFMYSTCPHIIIGLLEPDSFQAVLTMRGFSTLHLFLLAVLWIHRARIPSTLPLRVAKTGRNHLNEEFTPLLPTGIGE